MVEDSIDIFCFAVKKSLFELFREGGEDLIGWSKRFDESLGRWGGIQFLREVPDMMVSGYRFAAAWTVRFLARRLSCAAP